MEETYEGHGNISGTFKNENISLFAGDFPKTIIPVTVASGSGVIAKNTVLGKITESGKYAAYDNLNEDGTEVARVILKFDVDATSEDVKTYAYRTGHFNRSALVGLDAAAEEDFDRTPIILGDVFEGN